LKYNSLEDFLISFPLSIDGCLHDDCCANFSIKGIELNATILFADITSYSARTYELNPIENLIFVNNFLGWMSETGLSDSHGIVDKYIGDEIMVVFANEFGSKDHFLDAIQAAVKMINGDTLDFHPHIGIASGKIIIGYTGTPVKYNCSVFGTPVIIASRCASIKSRHYNSIIFPALCREKDYSPEQLLLAAGKTNKKTIKRWNLEKPRFEKVKTINNIEVMELYNDDPPTPKKDAAEKAKEHFEILKNAGFYRESIINPMDNRCGKQ